MSGDGGRARINAALRTDIENAVLCWLASVDAAGTPSVTPKEIFAPQGDDRIVVADIASAGTVRNIRAHPAVCVSFIDVFRQRGFKITGEATIIDPDDPRFAVDGADLLRMAGADFAVRHVISIQIVRVSRIWAPSYRLFPDRTEAERMQAAYDVYGVTPTDK